MRSRYAVDPQDPTRIVNIVHGATAVRVPPFVAARPAVMARIIGRLESRHLVPRADEIVLATWKPWVLVARGLKDGGWSDVVARREMQVEATVQGTTIMLPVEEDHVDEMVPLRRLPPFDGEDFVARFWRDVAPVTDDLGPALIRDLSDPLLTGPVIAEDLLDRMEQAFADIVHRALARRGLVLEGDGSTGLRAYLPRRPGHAGDTRVTPVDVPAIPPDLLEEIGRRTTEAVTRIGAFGSNPPYGTMPPPGAPCPMAFSFLLNVYRPVAAVDVAITTPWSGQELAAAARRLQALGLDP